MADNIFTSAPDFQHSEQAFRQVSAQAFDNIVHNRRSIRVFTDEPVPEDVVNQVLDWALLAPNSSNLQPWEFFWVRDPEKKQEMMKACFSQPAATTAQELIVAVAKTNTWRMRRREMLEFLDAKGKFPKRGVDYYHKLVPLAYTQGPLSILGFVRRIVMSVVGIFRAVPRGPNSHADMRVWAVKSTALACQNIMMGFSAHGFDTCPMEGMDAARVKKILNLGRGSEIVMVISAGKRRPEKVYGTRIRMPRSTFIKTI